MGVKRLKIFVLSGLALVATSCFFTGVENTGRISDKEVTRVINELEQRQPSATLTVSADSLSSWKLGKRFYATDDQLRMLFEPSERYELDSIAFSGKELVYEGFDTLPSVSGQKTASIRFSDGLNHYIYHTHKALEELPVPYSIPLLIDLDMVADVARQLNQREVFIKTSVWYRLQDESMLKGRQYIAVRIVDVLPGNKVLPLKVIFEAADNHERAFVWMSAPGAAMRNRDFDSMFSLSNLRLLYPNISDKTWNLIANGNVAEEMTKEECRLSLGSPQRISPVPDQAGMREYWYYDGGQYLYFVDGLLKSYRK